MSEARFALFCGLPLAGWLHRLPQRTGKTAVSLSGFHGGKVFYLRRTHHCQSFPPESTIGVIAMKVRKWPRLPMQRLPLQPNVAMIIPLILPILRTNLYGAT